MLILFRYSTIIRTFENNLCHGRTVWGVQGGRRRPQAALQGIEGSGMAGPGENVESPWPPLPHTSMIFVAEHRA